MSPASPGAPPALLIEAFTEKNGAGNGAAVVWLQEPAPESWMQALAGSLRQSETAFLLRLGDDWILRWFTPTCEVPLCGHATLASVLALGHWSQLAPGSGLSLHTRSGPLPVQLLPTDPADPAGALAGAGGLESPWAAIQLPGGGLRPGPVPKALESLISARLGVGCERFWESALGYSVVLLPASAPLARLAPIASDLRGELRQGLVVMQPTAGGAISPPLLNGEPVDYQLRFFAPGLGIDEDPVTGSAHALVAPWWQQQLGRERVLGWQCSDRPGGMVAEAGSCGMIRLIGSGVLLWDGSLRIQPQPHLPVASRAGLPFSADGSGDAGTASVSGWSAWQALRPQA
jgi:predicted PhzF superfamily epimerase YddE/YHI9